MIDIDSARAIIAERARPLPPVRRSLASAIGCRLAEAPRADVDLPSADTSAMDGYATRANDLHSGASLPIAFEIPAGSTPPPLQPGHAARIFTGGILPAGADTVVPQEEAAVQDGGRVLLPAATPGRFVRRAGEVFAAGSELLPSGTPVTPQSVTLLGSAGAATIAVIPRPRVAVVSTGAELISIEEPARPGAVRDCNAVMLAALAARRGCEVSLTERVGDDAGAIKEALVRAVACAEVVVTCGGVSVGDYDWVPRVLAELGAEILFHKVSARPGKPLLAARLGTTWVMGLPGNPMSALVGWRLFVAPLCGALAGDSQAFDEPILQATLTARCGNHGDRTLLAPARLEANNRIAPLAWKGSHDVRAVAEASALLRIEAGADHAAGEWARYYSLE